MLSTRLDSIQWNSKATAKVVFALLKRKIEEENKWKIGSLSLTQSRGGSPLRITVCA